MKEPTLVLGFFVSDDINNIAYVKEKIMGIKVRRKGQTYNHLTILEDDYSGNHVLCRCNLCGSATRIRQNNVVSGHKKSCGCHRRTHPMSKTSTYSFWNSMRRRCDDRNRPNYACSYCPSTVINSRLVLTKKPSQLLTSSSFH